MKKSLVTGIYYHPEAYPPTLNALEELGDLFENIDVVHRPHLQTRWKYHTSVKLHASGKTMHAKEQEQSSFVKKILFFINFAFDLFGVCKSKKPAVVLLCDPMSLFAYILVKPFLNFKHINWYHNHDVTEIHQLRKFSIGWFAAKAEIKFFNRLDLFTLPSDERLKYFPLQKLKGSYICVPNYPSVKFYGAFKNKQPGDTIHLVFQGKVSASRGLEQMLSVLPNKISGKQVHLFVAGYCEESYSTTLKKMAAELQVSGQFHMAGELPYADIPRFTASCHIGISIYLSNDIMNTTSSMASNKLYEYAAVGLPVLYLDEERFVSRLKQYQWAIPVKTDLLSIQKAIETIALNYQTLSNAAENDFKSKLNFETAFKPVKEFLKQQVNS